MPIVTRQTVSSTHATTSSNTGVFHRIPLWMIKIVLGILSFIVLVLILLQSRGIWQIYSRTFFTLILATGFLLGFSFPALLNRFLVFHKVDQILHTVLAVLTVAALTVTVIYLMDNDRYSRTDDYKFMIGIGICVAIEAVICCVLAFWICFGSYTIVDTN